MIDEINKILNHPDVHKWVALEGQGELDVKPLVDQKVNIFHFDDDGGFIYIYHDADMYEVHTQFLPNSKNVLERARKSVQAMFLSTMCMEIWTKVPRNNIAAKKLTEKMGFIYQFTSGKFNGHDIDVYKLPYSAWLQSSGLQSAGFDFHKQLEEQKKTHGIEAENHKTDFIHDLNVGACLAMARAGQPEKGVALYNRWAVMAGYEPVKLLSLDPVIVDIRDCNVVIGQHKIGVLPCL